MRRVFHLRSLLLVLALGAGVPALRAADATAEPRVLTTAAEVRALPPSVASEKMRAVIRGVVTAAEPDWSGRFVIQDASAGIFVQNLGPQPKVGDLVEVDGWT